MIYITGDVHGAYDGAKLFGFNRNYENKLTRDDYLIVTGDFGFIWDEKSDKDLDRLTALKYTLLFVDGNHENFDLLHAYQVETWHGGKVHKIRENVIHLMRGQIYTIDGKTFFTFGGAESTDKEGREEGVSWWAAEVPSLEEFNEAKANLDAVGNRVDYIITHSINTSVLTHGDSPMSDLRYEPSVTTDYLEYFDRTVDYKVWFFGHYHISAPISEKKVCLYNEVLIIKNREG